MVFSLSVPQQLRRWIEHDLVVIPGIIERRDIDLSPPVGEWPLFALTGRLESAAAYRSR
jgi:hypothetical protein